VWRLRDQRWRGSIWRGWRAGHPLPHAAMVRVS
jgi:hypothetical protein